MTREPETTSLPLEPKDKYGRFERAAIELGRFVNENEVAKRVQSTYLREFGTRRRPRYRSSMDTRSMRPIRSANTSCAQRMAALASRGKNSIEASASASA